MRIASFLLGAERRIRSGIATAAARSEAIVGLRTQFGPEGRVLNLAKEPSRISVGSDGYIHGSLQVFAHAGQLKIGDWFYLGPGSTVWSSDREGVTIGNRVLVSYNVHIHDTNSHPLDAERRFAQTRAILTTGHPKVEPGIRSSPIVIGNDVWIGTGALIFRGSVIGDRAVIGAHSLVRGNVPDDGIVRAGQILGI